MTFIKVRAVILSISMLFILALCAPMVASAQENGMNNNEICNDISCENNCDDNDCHEDGDEYFFEIVKEWDGDLDSIDLEGVDVIFTIGDSEWRPGFEPIEVEPGEILSPLTEEVNGLPDNCSYDSDLPFFFAVPDDEDEVATFTRSNDEDESDEFLYTLTVTNTVTCTTGGDDEEEPGDDTEVIVTPAPPTTPATPTPTTPTSLPNTGNSVATIVALMTAVTAGAAMFSTTLRSALIKFNS